MLQDLRTGLIKQLRNQTFFYFILLKSTETYPILFFSKSEITLTIFYFAVILYNIFILIPNFLKNALLEFFPGLDIFIVLKQPRVLNGEYLFLVQRSEKRYFKRRSWISCGELSRICPLRKMSVFVINHIEFSRNTIGLGVPYEDLFTIAAI